jgi:hypothetical protein
MFLMKIDNFGMNFGNRELSEGRGEECLDLIKTGRILGSLRLFVENWGLGRKKRSNCSAIEFQ